MWAYQCMNSPLYMSDSGFGEFAFCIKVWNPATFGSFNSNKHQLLSCTSKFKIESQESDVQVWKWKVFWLVLDSPRWIPCNFGRAGKKANRAGTHCKRLYGNRARKRWTVDGAPPLSQQRKAMTVLCLPKAPACHIRPYGYYSFIPVLTLSLSKIGLICNFGAT